MAACTASMPFAKEADADLACTAASFTPTTVSRQNSESIASPASSRSSSPPPASLARCSLDSCPRVRQSDPFGDVLYAARFHELDGLDLWESTLLPVSSGTDDVKMLVEKCTRVPFAQKLAAQKVVPEESDIITSAPPSSSGPQLQSKRLPKVPFAQKFFSARMNVDEELEADGSFEPTNCGQLHSHQRVPLAPVACAQKDGSSPNQLASSFAMQKLAARECDFQGVESIALIELAEKASTETGMEQKSASAPFTQKGYVAQMRCRPERDCDTMSTNDRDFEQSAAWNVPVSSKKQNDDKSGAVVKGSFAQHRFAMRMRDDLEFLL